MRARIFGLTLALLALAFVLGFVLMSSINAVSKPASLWGAICRAIGLGVNVAPASEPQPPPVIPSLIAWTPATAAAIAAGNAERGAFIALNCSVCHGENGVSSTAYVPTLAGMDAAAVYKELADYRSGKRLWGVMNGIAQSLTTEDAADVAAYYAHAGGGLPALTGREAPAAGRSLRAASVAERLIFAGDPARGIAPCSSCHGPGGYKLGAPALASQQRVYLEEQSARFAEGSRRNDINEQMRSIAAVLTAKEASAVAAYYAQASP
jgi:cytochrome c553